MRLFTRFSGAVLIAFSLLRVGVVLGDSAPPQQLLKIYRLHNSPRTADISPDERLVVTESTTQQNSTDSGTKTFLEVVQVWNFKEDKLVAEFIAHREDVKASVKGRFSDPVLGQRIVRFSPDGSLVIALVAQTIHVLRAIDLTEVRSIAIDFSGDETQNTHHPQNVIKPSVRALEISPNGAVVAVLWVRGMLDGRIQVYNLSSGRNALGWGIPQGWIGFTGELAWHPDGQLILVAIPNALRCSSPNSQPDVFAFDAQNGATKQEFRTGFLPGSIAVSSDNRVLAVDLSCLGVFKNRDPKLKVFDLITGKHLRDLSGRGGGVRYLVSASANGTRFLAFTGKMKTGFDWGDFVPLDVVVDETFSVWNLKTYEGIVTSQNIPGLKSSGLRISPKGGYAVSYGKASFVYELPSSDFQ